MKKITDLLNQLRPVTCQQVTLPFTPPCNGLLIVRMRTTTTGRFYEAYTNTKPAGTDGYNTTEGYGITPHFVEKGKQVAVTARSNVKDQLYMFIPLKIGGVS